MAKNTQDIEDMLDYLKLEVMGKSLDRMVRSPAYASYNPLQFLREIVSDEFTHQHNGDVERSLRLGIRSSGTSKTNKNLHRTCPKGNGKNPTSHRLDDYEKFNGNHHGFKWVQMFWLFSLTTNLNMAIILYSKVFKHLVGDLLVKIRCEGTYKKASSIVGKSGDD